MRKSHYKSHSSTFDYLEEKTLEDFRTRRPLTNDEEDFKALLESTIDPENENAVIIPDEICAEDQQLLEEACIEIEDTDFFREYRAATLKECARLQNYLKPGRKYPLLARNPARVKQGRRFVYIGVDGELHIGRKGKPMKVAMASA